MPQETFAFTRTLHAAEIALREEVDPFLLLDAAGPIREVAPHLTSRLEAKARQAFRVRAMLKQATIGRLGGFEEV
jgi:hypothetical protein